MAAHGNGGDGGAQAFATFWAVTAVIFITMFLIFG
jgi:hypothetical protein